MKSEKMGALDKIKNAKKSNWLTEGLNKKEVEEIVNLARISGRIENKRKSLNMTQKELSKKIGISASNITKYEIGQLEPNLEIITKLSKVFYWYLPRFGSLNLWLQYF